MTYIHYGHSKFDKSHFKQIRNHPLFTKPFGGLWGGIKDSWKSWCIQNNFETDLTKNFKFKVNGKIMRIHDKADMIKLKPYIDVPSDSKLHYIQGLLANSGWISPNYEKMKQDYDAIEVLAGSNYDLYMALYGWDVDSICVLNPECIEEVND